MKLAREAEAARVKALSGHYSVETWKPWVEASAAFQAAVTAHAEASTVNRYELEMAAKKAVREEAS